MKKTGDIKERTAARRKVTKQSGSENRLPTDRELLLTLGTLDSCEARVPTAQDHHEEVVPQWCEIRLTLERDDKVLPINLRRHDGELIIECLHEVLHPTSGRSILQHLWSELDAMVDEIQEGEGGEVAKGEAKGMALAIAYMTNPYNPSVDHVRSLAMERWEARR